MHFVVYLCAAKKYAVIPPHWLADGRNVWAKFVNYGLNPNQTYLCYYKRKNGHFDEDDGADFEHLPRFSLSLADEHPPVLLEANYHCKIVKYFYREYQFDILIYAIHEVSELEMIVNMSVHVLIPRGFSRSCELS